MKNPNLVRKLAEHVVEEARVSPVVRHRLAAMLDALSSECIGLAHDEGAPPETWRRVLRDIETLAEVLRETELADHGDDKTEWTLSDRAHDAAVARTIERGSGKMRIEREVEQSGFCRSLSMEDARRVIEELRREDAVRHDVQRALA